MSASANQQLLDRIEAEIAFARGLADGTPARAAEWRPLITRVEEIVSAMKAGRMRGNPAAGVARAGHVGPPMRYSARTGETRTV